jgi:hypothetical protein
VGSVTSLFLAAACGSAGATPSPHDAAKARPALKIVSLSPLTVKGAKFVPGERVKLLVSGAGGKSKAARADRHGRFTAAFAVKLDRCASFVVQAVGARGSRAMVDVTAPNCATPDVISPTGRAESDPPFGLPYERP